MTKHMHLNLFIHGRGHHEAAWRHPDASPLALTDIRYYTDIARKAESGLFDSIFLADSLLVGEHVRGIEAKAAFLIAGGGDIIHADPEYDMGITGAIKIAHVCQSLGLDVQYHACGPAHRAVMAATPNTHFYEMALIGPEMPNMVPRSMPAAIPMAPMPSARTAGCRCRTSWALGSSTTGTSSNAIACNIMSSRADRTQLIECPLTPQVARRDHSRHWAMRRIEPA